ncbi:5053_t:CDS:2 [Entrophospora sp. SA101]|nr:5053_t:CDS:2 [Entrophospora sp. SA101]
MASVETDVIESDTLLNSAEISTMKDMLHVDEEEYAINFNKTYYNNVIKHFLLKTSSSDNMSMIYDGYKNKFAEGLWNC